MSASRILAAIAASFPVMGLATLAFGQDAPPATPPTPTGSAAPVGEHAVPEPMPQPVPSARAPEPTSAASVPPAAPPAEEEEMVEIHVESPTPVRLIRRHGSNTEWWHVCMSPCDQRGPIADEYMLVGSNVHASRPFRLDPTTRGKVTLRASPGLKSKYETGKYVLGGGGVLVLGGLVTLLAGASPSSTFDADGITHNRNQTAISVGSLLILTGVAVGITGGAWLLDNAETKVRGTGPAPGRSVEPVPAPPPPQTGLGAVRQVAMPTFLVPIVSGTF